MPFSYSEATRVFTLSTERTTYQMRVDEHGYLLHLYYGARTEGDMSYLVTYCDRSGMCGCPHDVADRTYSLDVLPQEFPFQGSGDMRSPLLIVRGEDGTFGCDLRYRSHEVRPGKYALPGLPAAYDEGEDDGAETLSVMLADDRLGLEVELLFGVMPRYDVITRAAVVRNCGRARVTVEKLQSACLDFVHGDFDLITFDGRHAMERRPSRRAVENGSLSVGSRRGMSSNQYNPMMVLCDRDATETSGRAWSMSFVWSGSFLAEAERDQYEQTRVQMGLASDLFSYPLEPGEQIVAPEVIMTYSGAGIERISHNLHRCIRERVCRGPWRDAARPILINSWEACYFDFTGDKLVELAKKAAELGLDMLVMDDGWFGSRSDDHRGLGDWRPNMAKLGGTVADLARRVNEVGLGFGIWVEPEMVNEDSDLFRAHPDWALTVPGKEPVLGRDQLVLDLSRADVRDNLFEQLCAVLDQGGIEYVKWDYNRSIVDVHSRTASDQGKVLYDYMLGLYDLLERVRTRYPDLLIEGCSAGGGRFDAGMLHYTPQIWTSDNTDARNRLEIQYGTSFGYPCSAIGAHVSACPNEITGRTVPLGARGTVAMGGGAFGYELDLMELNERACELIKSQVRTYRGIEHLVREGLLYRLSDPKDADAAAWEFVSEDGSEALVCAVVTRVDGYGKANYVVPRGLTPGATYRMASNGTEYSADALMDMGLPLSVPASPYESFMYRFERVD
ncbi:MAG TPA: alpha-galactosidase [Candidatus Olsenella pullistercoris]|uniref:Alpha-galactosidase n=1 Tax=Candidatus Olsenella pullistercoris TaxID=2838712 RepID=A0A9D2EYZ5_9ACTN|nr:alpha-galactosidase [Candidatus Olsenella pullistercoris]